MNIKVVPIRDDTELTPCSTTRYISPHTQRCDDRLAQTSKTMRSMLDMLGENNRYRSWSKSVFGFVLLADISGFTQLSTILSVEQLKFHINSFFTLLLSTVKRFDGDTVKFCGDAVIIIWTADLDASQAHLGELAATATRCGLAVIEACGSYDKGTPSKPVSLRLHCGLSAGPLHCMVVGDKHRMEFLVSGSQLRSMGTAAGEAKTGELCVTHHVQELLQHRFSTHMTCNGNYIVDGELHVETTKPRWTLKAVATAVQTAMALKHDDPVKSQRGSFYSRNSSISFSGSESYEDTAIPSIFDAELDMENYSLTPFLHECTRQSIQLQASDLLAEIRCVVTIFIELLELDHVLDAGDVDKPQVAMMTILGVLRALGGSLRQFVVDDKGCVVICSFGVPGFSYDNNELRAIFTAMGIRDGLQEHGISCRIGIASGNAYCGYVGSRERKEYCCMGSSVNLAARLMGKALCLEILVSESIYAQVMGVMEFAAMPAISAKGYDHPIDVFSVVKRDISLEAMVQSSFCVNRPTTKLLCRFAEVSAVRSHIHDFLRSNRSCMDRKFIQHNRSETSNRYLIVGPEGYGKTALVSHLLFEETVLSSVAHVSCHLADMDEAYSAILTVLRAVFSCQEEKSVCSSVSGDINETKEFVFDDEDEKVANENLIVKLKEYVKVHMPQCYLLAAKQLRNFKKGSTPRTSISCLDSLMNCHVVDIPEESMETYQNMCGLSIFSLPEILDMLPVCIAHCQINNDPPVDVMQSVLLLRYALAHILRTAVENSEIPMLIVEDIHWCDETSFDTFMVMLRALKHGYFLGSMRPSNASMAGKYSRSDSMMSFADAKSYLKQLNQICDTMKLQLFTENDVRTVVDSIIEPSQASILKPAFDDKCINTIYRHSKGVPGAVFDIAFKVKKSALNPQSVKLAADRDVDIDVVHVLDSMSPVSQLVLKVAAVCGTKFSVEIVRKVLDQMECTDMSSKVVAAVSEIKRSYLIRRCMPIWEMPSRVWPDSTWKTLNFPMTTGNKKSLQSVAKGIKAIVSIYSDARSQSVRDSNCFAFTDKRVRESIYGVMLADQQMNMHGIIAAVVEHDYMLEKPTNDTQIAILKFVAFHYSRAGNIAKDVYYSELVASRLYAASLMDEASEYYHHLVELATERSDIGSVIRYVTNGFNQERRRSSVILGAANRLRVKAFRHANGDDNILTHYLTPLDISKTLTPATCHVSTLQLQEYLIRISMVDYKRFNFAKSHTLLLVERYALRHKSNLVSCFKPLYLSTCLRDVLLYQSELCMLRGSIQECANYAETAIALLRQDLSPNDVTLHQAMTLHTLARRLLRKTAKHDSVFAEPLQHHMPRKLKITPEADTQLGVSSFYHSLCYIACCDLRSARITLTHILNSDIPMTMQHFCSQSLLAWIHFACGRVDAAIGVAEGVSPSHDIFEIWRLQIYAVCSIMEGDLDSANTHLDSMQRLQKNRYGSVFHYALSGVVMALKYLSDGGNSDDLTCIVKTLTRISDQLIRKRHVSPIAVVSSFLSAYVLCMMLRCITTSNEEDHLELFPDALKCVEQHRKQLEAVAQVFPFVKTLEGALGVKLRGTLNCGKNYRVGCFAQVASQPDATTVQFILSDNVTCLCSEFAFGKAFWLLEMYKSLQNVQTLDDAVVYKVQKLYKGAVHEFNRFHTTEMHPLFL